MLEKIEKFEEILERDLDEMMDQVIRAGKINPNDTVTIMNATKLMLKLKKYKEWEEAGMSYDDDGYSARRGRSMTTGRFMSRDRAPYGSYDNGGYSGHNRQMLDHLEDMRSMARSPEERRMIEEMMNRY